LSVLPLKLSSADINIRSLTLSAAA